MYRRLPWLGALFFIITVAGYAQQPASPKTYLKAVQAAPDFTLTHTQGKEVTTRLERLL